MPLTRRSRLRFISSVDPGRSRTFAWPNKAASLIGILEAFIHDIVLEICYIQAEYHRTQYRSLWQVKYDTRKVQRHRQFARKRVCLISNLSYTSRIFWKKKKHNRCLFLKAAVKRTLSETLEESENTSSDASFLFTEHFKSSRMPSKEVAVEWPFSETWDVRTEQRSFFKECYQLLQH